IINSNRERKLTIISNKNIKSAQYMNPPLTTLSLNTKYMGELAGGLLIQMIDSDNESPVKLVCATELMIRESVYKR
ncbi:MAG: substrate-binding domain-containing protein, partial [Atopostipes sp.]|nr:substrate-binding domain-containing protein [Atopostipes sp.]